MIGNKEAYNITLKRFRSAEKYLDSPERTSEECKKWEGKFLEIVRELSQYINKHKDMTDKEILEGFKI